MGIYNPMMKLPTSCYNCPYAFSCSILTDLFGEQWDTDNLWDYDLMTNRYKKCPLVEIPTPHGDLIDKSELIVEPISDSEYGPNAIYGITAENLDSASVIIRKE